jgi:hypothetical protein
MEKEHPILEILNNWQLWLIASLTLGLAPFTPEPHIIADLRWGMGGAVGMQAINWLDLFMHGTPFLLLFRSLIILFVRSRKTAAADK